MSEQPNNKTNDVVYTIVDIKPKTVAYTDLIERLPYRSSRGNEHILVGYHYDDNSILVEPLKNRTAPVITQTWENINKKLHQPVYNHSHTSWIMKNQSIKK